MSPTPSAAPLDDIDRAILCLLNDDARHTTAVEIGECIGVSDSTVRNRIQNLEDQGIITQYTPIISFEQAGYSYVVDVTCTVKSAQRHEKAKQIRKISGVIAIFELMSGTGNLNIHIAGRTLREVDDIIEQIDAVVDAIEDEEIIRDYYFQGTKHFSDKIDDESYTTDNSTNTDDHNNDDEGDDEE